MLGVSGVSSAETDVLDADEVRREGWKVRPYIYGKELVYKIHARTIGRAKDGAKGGTIYANYPDVLQRGTRELTLGRPMAGRTYIPSRLLHFQPNAGEPHTDEDPLLTFFQGFDGRKTNTYVRRLLHDYQTRQHIHSSGTEQIGSAVAAFKADPMVRLLINRTEPFQGLPIKEYNFVELKDQIKAERVEHPADANAIRVSSTDPAVESYTIVSSAPEHLILERRLYYPDGPFVIEVSKLTSFDGHRYPGRATYRELNRDGSFGWEATIELISVESIDVDKTEWIPPWPAGTEWKREQDRKHFEVPYTEEQLRQIQAAGLARSRSDTSEGRPESVVVDPQVRDDEPDGRSAASDGRSFYFYANFMLVAIIAPLLAYRLWPKKEAMS
ncbi:hypothetical protein Mal15_08200 [Stieleria maiorica]|uniref:Uncharacterized protein n=1 Tax=Stieleria maiorica TaxID=2795974 RepID=A0A5B9M9R0_9BACT|nr:hypothetical protein [Stieleria maiorica]QEF96790.1 hypothetical protein Mal15_08200 [Stieleria maiorica]